ncbi:MAG TPA: hypothetical protein VE487_18215 [Ilumatobacter sp.]|jgi:hypothetical protein|nr:hypothetical protein [Ilumatobacter sp.]
MDEWAGLRTAVVVVSWLTVLGGLTLAITWFVRGGGRAVGPEDEGLEDVAGQHARGRSNRAAVTSFSVAQVATHGLLGVLTAALVTYGAVRDSDRSTGYIAILAAIAVTAVPGIVMFRKWRTNTRPAVSTAVAPTSGRVEDHIPRAVVYGHGLGAAAIAGLVLVLLIVD